MKKDNNGNFNHDEEFGQNMNKLLNLLRKIMKHQKIDNDELKMMFQEITKDKNSINFNVFFALMPMSPEELDEMNIEFEDMFEDDAYGEGGDAELKFELSMRDEDFLKKHGIKF
ncbi:MAG: hypothetical protein JW938_00465 [Candidatus Omnitrophica bacterium]|nr:hypothetical protein [Candidatus Omnitrophota bacterium]